MTDQSKPRSWLERLSGVLMHEPRDRKELIEVLHEAEKSHVLNHESLTMIEGVLEVSEMQVRDVMIPRAHMVTIQHQHHLEQILPIIIDSGHSRFPVVGENADDVIGILLAKDLLRYCINKNEPFILNNILRPAIFVPESKRLDSLLKELRDKHHHIAVVVDEYGGIAGLVTIEDIIEQIVGDIEDEYDREENENELIKKINEKEFIITPILSIEDFNEYFGTQFNTEQFDTIGGLVLNQFGHLPHHGEETHLGIYHFTVLHSDKRRINSLRMEIKN